MIDIELNFWLLFLNKLTNLNKEKKWLLLWKKTV